LLSDMTRRIFRLRYGIDDNVGCYCFSPGKKQGPRKGLVDDAGLTLIENTLQLTMVMESEAAQKGDTGEEDRSKKGGVGEDADRAAGRGSDGSRAKLAYEKMNVAVMMETISRMVSFAVVGKELVDVSCTEATYQSTGSTRLYSGLPSCVARE